MQEHNVRFFFNKFKRDKAAMAGLVFLVSEVILLILLPPLLKLDPYTIAGQFNAAPSASYWLGTDDVGRDMFARIIYGGRTSLFIGLASTLINIVIGLPLGLIAGYYKGAIRSVIMRLTDIFLSIPVMVLALAIVAIFRPSVTNIILCLGVTGWADIAKLIYGSVLSTCGKEYIEAARAIGTKDFTIIWKYVLPNSIGPLWMSLAFRISRAIILESSLSFLGVGVKAPEASWGNILYLAQNHVVLTMRWWIWVPTGIILMLTIACINLVGEGIRDTLDPKHVIGGCRVRNSH